MHVRADTRALLSREMGCPPPAGGGMSPPHASHCRVKVWRGEAKPPRSPDLNGLPQDSSLTSLPPYPASPSQDHLHAAQHRRLCLCVREGTYPTLPFLSSWTPTNSWGHTDEGLPISTQDKPGPKPQHCASYLPSPEILNQRGKLCSLFRVAQARLSHDVSSEEVPLPETFRGIRTESMTLALNWTVLSCGYPGRPVWDQPQGSPGSS